MSASVSGPEIDRLMRTPHWRQKSDLERLAADLKRTYPDDAARFRAAFAWTAQHIRYDLNLLNDGKSYPGSVLVANAIRRRAALCEGYVAVLDSLSRLMDIPTFKIPGYTRWQGKLQAEPHLWVAVKLGGQWHLADPTWASGSIINGRFRAAYDTTWFLTPPETMISSHMPYDPLWQLLSRPMSHEGFIRNNGSRLKGEWNTTDSIAYFLQSNLLQQYEAELRRIRQGFSHQALQSRITFLEQAIHVQKHNQLVQIMQQSNALFNAAVQAYNQAVDEFNSLKPRTQVLGLLLRAEQLLGSARAMLPQDQISPALSNEFKMMNRQMAQLEERLSEARTNWY
ncbi:MAG TPA: transglutaminase domain-containing protein [Bacteroidales bacterium]|nr:transglutaminase domain-containing protein [Bacteroidales bacterium]